MKNCIEIYIASSEVLAGEQSYAISFYKTKDKEPCFNTCFVSKDAGFGDLEAIVFCLKSINDLNDDVKRNASFTIISDNQELIENINLAKSNRKNLLSNLENQKKSNSEIKIWKNIFDLLKNRTSTRTNFKMPDGHIEIDRIKILKSEAEEKTIEYNNSRQKKNSDYLKSLKNSD